MQMRDATPKPGWTRVSFGDVVKLNTDRCADPAAAGIERYVGLEHIEPEDLRIRRWGLVAEGTTFTNRFRPGQVLFGKRRAYQRKVAVAEFEGVCSSDIYVFEPKDERLLPELLPFLCQTEAFYAHAVGTSAGSLSPRTNWTQLATYEFALPPLEEQRRIVGVLTLSDSICNEYQECLNSAYALRASIRAAEFDPVRYGFRTLSNLCVASGIQIGPFGAQLHQSDYLEHGIPVVMPTDMIDEQIDLTDIARVSEVKAQELANHRLRVGDILLPRRGELDRRAYVGERSEGWLCGTGSIRVRVLESVSPRAVFHALASVHSVRWLKGNAVGTTMPNLNSSIVAQIPIALPPQPRLAMVTEQLDYLQIEIRQLQKRLTTARQLKPKLQDMVLLNADNAN
jgi:type I restriction enzyme S subunit